MMFTCSVPFFTPLDFFGDLSEISDSEEADGRTVLDRPRGVSSPAWVLRFGDGDCLRRLEPDGMGSSKSESELLRSCVNNRNN